LAKELQAFLILISKSINIMSDYVLFAFSTPEITGELAAVRSNGKEFFGRNLSGKPMKAQCFKMYRGEGNELVAEAVVLTGPTENCTEFRMDASDEWIKYGLTKEQSNFVLDCEGESWAYVNHEALKSGNKYRFVFTDYATQMCEIFDISYTNDKRVHKWFLGGYSCPSFSIFSQQQIYVAKMTIQLCTVVAKQRNFEMSETIDEQIGFVTSLDATNFLMVKDELQTKTSDVLMQAQSKSKKAANFLAGVVEGGVFAASAEYAGTNQENSETNSNSQTTRRATENHTKSGLCFSWNKRTTTQKKWAVRYGDESFVYYYKVSVIFSDRSTLENNTGFVQFDQKPVDESFEIEERVFSNPVLRDQRN